MPFGFVEMRSSSAVRVSSLLNPNPASAATVVATAADDDESCDDNDGQNLYHAFRQQLYSKLNVAEVKVNDYLHLVRQQNETSVCHNHAHDANVDAMRCIRDAELALKSVELTIQLNHGEDKENGGKTTIVATECAERLVQCRTRMKKLELSSSSSACGYSEEEEEDLEMAVSCSKRSLSVMCFELADAVARVGRMADDIHESFGVGAKPVVTDMDHCLLEAEETLGTVLSKLGHWRDACTDALFRSGTDQQECGAPSFEEPPQPQQHHHQQHLQQQQQQQPRLRNPSARGLFCCLPGTSTTKAYPTNSSSRQVISKSKTLRDASILKELKETIQKQALEVEKLKNCSSSSSSAAVAVAAPCAAVGAHGVPAASLEEVSEYINKTFLEVAMRRIWWLGLFLMSLSFTAVIVNGFEHTLSRQIELAFFMPLLAGHGGNAGGQTVGTILSALTAGSIGLKDAPKIVVKETCSGLTLGCILGALLALFSYYFMGISLHVSTVILCSLPLVSAIASALGSSIPFLCVAMGLDPIVIAAPAMTSFVDVGGLLVYFLIANQVFNFFGLEL